MTDPFDRAVLREKIERREQRTRHVAAGFRCHATTFLIVNAVLILLWIVGSASEGGDSTWSDPWPAWVVLGWGIGLAFHWSHLRSHQRRDAELRARLGDVGAQ